MATKRWPKPNLEFVVPIYGGRVYLFRTAAKFNAALRYMDLDEDEPVWSGRCIHTMNMKSGGHTYLIGGYNERVTTLAHEIDHLTFHILDTAGVPVSIDSSTEAHAYLLESLMEIMLSED